MAKPAAKGHLQYLLEVKLRGDQTSLTAHRDLLQACQQFEVMFDSYQVRPTWAIEAPLMGAVCEALGSNANVALLVSDVDELNDYLHHVSATPSRFGAVVTRFRPELLQVAELGAVGTRALGVSEAMPSDGRIQTRHGLSIVPTTARLPGYGKLFGSWDRVAQAKSRLHRAVSRGTTEVISVPLDQVDNPMSALRALRRALALTQRLCAAKRVVCESLLDTHQRLCPSVKGRRIQRSVLRAA